MSGPRGQGPWGQIKPMSLHCSPWCGSRLPAPSRDPVTPRMWLMQLRAVEHFRHRFGVITPRGRPGQRNADGNLERCCHRTSVSSRNASPEAEVADLGVRQVDWRRRRGILAEWYMSAAKFGMVDVRPLLMVYCCVTRSSMRSQSWRKRSMPNRPRAIRRPAAPADRASSGSLT